VPPAPLQILRLDVCFAYRTLNDAGGIPAREATYQKLRLLLNGVTEDWPSGLFKVYMAVANGRDGRKAMRASDEMLLVDSTLPSLYMFYQACDYLNTHAAIAVEGGPPLSQSGHPPACPPPRVRSDDNWPRDTPREPPRFADHDFALPRRGDASRSAGRCAPIEETPRDRACTVQGLAPERTTIDCTSSPSFPSCTPFLGLRTRQIRAERLLALSRSLRGG